MEVSGDDGTGLLITSDTDNDIVAGRSNADNIMWDQSVVDSDDDKMGYSVINRGYNFRLKLHPGKWKEGKSGTIRITFKNVMRAGNQTSYTDYPFYTTIEWYRRKHPIQIVENLFSIFTRFGSTNDYTMMRIEQTRDLRKILLRLIKYVRL